MSCASTFAGSTGLSVGTPVNFSTSPGVKPILRSAKKPAVKSRGKTGKAKKKPTSRHINGLSVKRRHETRQYLAVRADYLRLHPHCLACKVFGIDRKHPATEIHHIRGKIHGLLCDTRFFISTCSAAHQAIHKNPKLAQHLGLLAGAGEWNVVPRE